MYYSYLILLSTLAPRHNWAPRNTKTWRRNFDWWTVWFNNFSLLVKNRTEWKELTNGTLALLLLYQLLVKYIHTDQSQEDWFMIYYFIVFIPKVSLNYLISVRIMQWLVKAQNVAGTWQKSLRQTTIKIDNNFKMAFFSDVAPCGRSLRTFQRQLLYPSSGRWIRRARLIIRPYDGGSMHLWNVVQDYTALQVRRQSSSYTPSWEPQISSR